MSLSRFLSRLPRLVAVLAVGLLGAQLALAQDANLIRKNIAERLPDFPKIDEVTRTSIPGLYEIRSGTEVFYTDEQGNHLIQGDILDTKSRVNITQARIAKLTAINFASLPLKDAIVWKSGTGKRRIAIFADPNCGYCKRFEHDLQSIKDVTVYTFVIPILGGDSPEKSRAIWCAKDNTATWRNWMLDGKAPPRLMGACDATAIERNLALANKHRVQATPSLVFEDGIRVSGAIPNDQVEKHFAQAAQVARN